MRLTERLMEGKCEEQKTQVVFAVFGWSLFLLWVCKPVSALLGDQLSPGKTSAQRAVEQPHLLGADVGL